MPLDSSDLQETMRSWSALSPDQQEALHRARRREARASVAADRERDRRSKERR